MHHSLEHLNEKMRFLLTENLSRWVVANTAKLLESFYLVLEEENLLLKGLNFPKRITNVGLIVSFTNSLENK